MTETAENATANLTKRETEQARASALSAAHSRPVVLETAEIHAWRRACRKAFAADNSCTFGVLRQRLLSADEGYPARHLERLLKADPLVTQDGTRFTIDHVALSWAQISSAIVARLTDRSVPWSPEQQDLLAGSVASGEIARPFTLDTVLEVATAMVANGRLRTLTDGQLVLAQPQRLPLMRVAPGTPAPPGQAVWNTSTQARIGRAVRRGSPLIVRTLETPFFQALRLSPLPAQPSAPALTCTAVDVGGRSVLVVALVGSVSLRELTALETDGWWLWQRTSSNPLHAPGERAYAADFTADDGSVSLFVTPSPTAAADAIATGLEVLGIGDDSRVAVSFIIAPVPPEAWRRSGHGVSRLARTIHRRARRPSERVVLGSCRNCQKDLTDPVSFQRGFGPECWTRELEARAEEREHLAFPRWEAPLSLAAWKSWAGLS